MSEAARLPRWYYRNIPELGNVVLTDHAQDKLARDRVTSDTVEEVLRKGRSTPDGQSVVLREWRNIRLVIETQPDRDSGAVVVLTGYRVMPPGRAC